MNILITGGAGFIASWIAESYIADGHDVFVIDNLSTGNIDNVPNEAEFFECDICDLNKVKDIFSKVKPDIVNHHAAQVNVRYSVENPSRDAQTNVVGSINIIEESKNYNVKKILFASSGGAIYGEPEVNPVSESAVPNPLSPYGTAKLCVENYLNHYSNLYSLDYVALRYANVYGERQNPRGEAGVIAIFCDNILNGKDCTIFGDGNQIRDYIHYSDVVEANLLSLKSDITGIYNIGTSFETSVNNIVDSLNEISNKQVRTLNIPKKEGEVERICLNNSLANEKLGWSPKTEFKYGIEKTWNWYLNNQFD